MTLRLSLFLLALVLWALALGLLARLYQRFSAQLRALLGALQEAQRRARREVATAEAAREQAVLEELLPVLDNLDRALAAPPPAGAEPASWETWVSGVRLTRRQFLESLARLGVRPIDALGQPFDPRVHEAVAAVPDALRPPGTVLTVLRAGFLQGERLVRPALVTVSRAPTVDD